MAKSAKHKKTRLGLLTGGGDCPGLNAAIRAVTKTALLDHDMHVIGFQDGFDGLIHNRHHRLDYEAVSGILTRGGTILGTNNRANPFAYPTKRAGKTVFEDVSDRAVATFRKHRIDALVAVGGDGTLLLAHKLAKKAGISIIGVPKTIDNDLKGTDFTVGFYTAVRTASQAIDAIHDTAQSHHRAMIVEVMGRNAGWLALYSGIAAGGDVILIPEIPYDIDAVAARIKHRSRLGMRFTIIVVSEGAHEKGGEVVVKERVADKSECRRLGGIGYYLQEQLRKRADVDVRTTVLGHVQRGGEPCPFDRVLATQFGKLAADLAADGQYGRVTAVVGGAIKSIPLSKVATGQRLVPPKHPLIDCVRSVGASMGDGE